MTTTAADFIRDERSGLFSPGVLELSGAVLPSEVEVEGDWLKIRQGDQDNAESSLRNPPTGMLDDFARVSSVGSVKKYVEKWGAFGICKHGFAAEHDAPWLGVIHLNGWNPKVLPDGVEYKHAGRNTRGQCRAEWGDGQGTFWEPIERYMYFASQANTILRLAGELRQGRLGTDAEWSQLFGGSSVSKADRSWKSEHGEQPGLRWEILMQAIREWMYLGDAAPTLIWSGTGPQFRIEGGPFGTLGIQMMLLVTGSADISVCDGCAILYHRAYRRPKPNQNNYCRTCGPRVRSLHSKRRIRAKQKLQKGDQR